MKKLIISLLTIMLIIVVFSPAKSHTRVDPTPIVLLEPGYYYLCCKDDDLVLYNMVGNMVGWGPDCGGLVGCYKVIVCSTPQCKLASPPDAGTVLNLINSMQAKSGPPHEGTWPPNMPSYYYMQSEINW